MTTFENKCFILGDLWIEYRNDTAFEEFIQMNDLGLPLAYAVSSGIVKSNDEVARFIDETFEALLTGLGIEEDGEWEDLESLLMDSR